MRKMRPILPGPADFFTAAAAALTALLGLGLLVTGLSGCAHVGVEPWQRDLLAKPGMELDSAPLESSADDHIYFSKESSSGGQGFGGGGCGCN